MVEIVKEIAIAVGRMFINPLLYVVIVMAIFLGYRRVKRERKYFHIRILWGWSECVGLIKEGLVFSFIISILSVAFGLAVPIEFLYVMTIISSIALIIYVFHFLSPIVLAAISLSVLVIMHQQQLSVRILGIDFAGVTIVNGTAVTVTLLAGLMLVAEGLLIKRAGARFASPIVEKTKRGLKGVAFFSKKVWVLPIFFVIPGNAINAYFPWWPQFSLGTEQFSLVLFPVVLGFQQMTRYTLPIYFYPKLGRAILILGQLVILGGLAAYFEPIIGIFVLIAGAIARIVISIGYKFREDKDVYAVSAKSNGVMIAAVLLNSPAEKMGLVAGEIIRKVNGVDVHTEDDLYEALQINAAHCRLEVLNHQNEIRLTQHVVYSDDHYRIGLLLAEK